jgi:hypothetical protein
MTQRSRADQDVRAGAVFANCTEKTQVREFGVFPRRDEPVLRARKALPEEKCSPTGTKNHGLV